MHSLHSINCTDFRCKNFRSGYYQSTGNSDFSLKIVERVDYEICN